ncbi:hypothetical protein D3C86_1718710 [compost metagenome]
MKRGQTNDSNAPIKATSAVQSGITRVHLWVTFSKSRMWSIGNVWVSGSKNRLLKAMSMWVMSNITNTAAAQSSGIPRFTQ